MRARTDKICYREDYCEARDCGECECNSYYVIEDCIEQVEWYFNEDDGIGADTKTKEAVWFLIKCAEFLQGEC